MAERQLPKLNVAGSIPVSRSSFPTGLPADHFCFLRELIIDFTPFPKPQFRSIKAMTDENVHFFSPTGDFALALGLMARHAFAEAFAHLYDPVPFAQFLNEANGTCRQDGARFADPSIRWQVATINGQPIGYAKLFALRAPHRRLRLGRWNYNRSTF